MAEFPEQVLWVRLLEIAAADLGGGDLRGDRQHGHTRPMRVEQAVDQVQIAGSAGAGADRKLASDVGFAGCCEGSHLLMAHMNPFDLAAAAQRFRETIEAVADNPEDAPDAGL